MRIMTKMERLDGKLLYLKSNAAELIPNTTIVKRNFSAVIDQFGRPVLNTMKDLKLKVEEGREALNNKFRDDTYRSGDEQGHIIADFIEGPASRENIVPQAFKVNRSQMKEVENIIKQYKAEGHKVDYEVKVNYIGSDKRPSSFEPKITVDGEVIPLRKELQKIYNVDNAGTATKVKTIIGEKIGLNHEVGAKAGLEAAMLTCAISTVDNIGKFMEGKISAEEMVVDIAKDTGTAGAIGYGSAFVSSVVAQGMSKSSHELIKKMGGAGVPAAVVSFGISSYDAISDFAQGEIDGMELAYDLGDNAAAIAGGMAGTVAVAAVSATASAAAGAKIGAVVGSVVPGAGTVAGAAAGAAVGFGISVVGGMVGTAIASEAYKTAVEAGSEGVEILADKLQTVAANTVEQAKAELPDKVEDIKSALNEFAVSNGLPIHL